MCNYFQGCEGCPPPSHPCFLPLFLYSVASVLCLWHLPSCSPPLACYFSFFWHKYGLVFFDGTLFWNYKVLPRKATCKRCKNRETFVGQMLSLLLFQLTRAFLRYRLSERTVALASLPKEGILEEVGEGQRLKVGVRRPVHKRRSLTRLPSVP